MQETKKIVVNFLGRQIELIPKIFLSTVPDFSGYEQKNIGISFEWEGEYGLEPFAVLTKNFGEFLALKNAAYVDTNNCPFAKELLTQGIAIDTGVTKRSGFCEYPLWEFNEDFLKSVDETTYEEYSNSFDAYMKFMCEPEC